MFPPETVSRRICPVHKHVILDAPREELSLELAPLEFSIPGFQSRIPPVTEAELESVGLVRIAAAGHGGVKS